MGFLHWVGQRFAKPHDPRNVRMGQRLVIGGAVIGGALLIPGVGAAVVHGAAAVGRGALGGARLAGRGVIGGGKMVGRGIVKGEQGVASLFHRKPKGDTFIGPPAPDTNASTDSALETLRNELSSNPGQMNQRGLPEPGGVSVSVSGFVPVPPTSQSSGAPTSTDDPKASVSPLLLAAVVLGVVMIARK